MSPPLLSSSPESMAAHRLNLHLFVFIIGLLIVISHVSAVTTTSDQDKSIFNRRFGGIIFNKKKVGGGGSRDGDVFKDSLHLVPEGPDPIHH
ncbi:hypothetical protein E6C27_scaffold44G002880 [Cucumis melo var. makuwa]|uniref:Uncharacterized protein n=2 Tax=Cucumis melo TaxID=3656 RepID=A0A5A7TN00_CUCMM|nr:hypothetical protein E6C27_scaffold44G002880 [Cucumis melo var. makuwa]